MSALRRIGVATVVAAALIAPGAPSALAATPVRVASASWNTPSSAWVLGTTGCADVSCTTVAATADGGASWARLAAPRSPIAPSGGNGVDDIERADAVNGYVYRPQLFSTHDGATTWRRITIPGGGRQVTSLTTSGGDAYIAVSTCVIGNPANCSAPATLWRSPVGADVWTQLLTSLPTRGFPQLSASKGTVYVTGASDSGAPFLLASTDGITFERRPVPCADPTISVLRAAPAGYDDIVLLCSENVGLGRFSKVTYVSPDTALTSRLRGQADTDGQPVDVAAQGRTELIAVSGGDSHILRSPDAGRTYARSYTGPSELLDGLQLVGSTASVVSGPAYFPEAAGELLLSHDGGVSWARSAVTV